VYPRHILCAIDSSDVTDLAFNEALHLARTHGSRLTLFQAVPLAERFNARGSERRRRLDALKKAATQHGVRTRIEVQQGDVAGLILLHARAREADLVVIGTHGRRGWARWRLGSIAEAVVQGAPCPTLVVPVASRSIEANRLTSPVLCAIDLLHGSERIVDYAIATSAGRAKNSLVTVLHVAHPVASPLSGSPSPQRDAQQGLLTLLGRHSERLRFVRTRVVQGSPAQQIVKAARQGGMTLIVLGISGRSALRKRIFGSTVTSVMRDSPCPVLLVPSIGSIRSTASSTRAA
jgi:nucleotide-binding universal stress UspA family protein